MENLDLKVIINELGGGGGEINRVTADLIKKKN